MNVQFRIKNCQLLPIPALLRTVSRRSVTMEPAVMDNEYIATYICMNIIQCCTMWMSFPDKNEFAIYVMT